MGGDVACVLTEEFAASRGFVGGFGLEERGQWDLGVDDQTSTGAEVHDEVGTDHAVVGGARVLLDEVDVLQHAGGFDQSA